MKKATKKKSEMKKYTPAEANRAMRLICDFLKDDEDLVLMFDLKRSVYLIPSVMSENSTEDKSKVGKVEFQVSDGMPGGRGSSHDFYDLAEAVKFFKRVKDLGWAKAVKTPA